MKKRLLSAFLAVMMVLTMAPVAFAADGGEAVAQQGTSVSLPTDNKGNLTISDDGAVLDGTKETYTNGTITVNAADVTIKNLTFGDKAKLVVNTSGKFTLTGCTFAPQTVYNKATELPVRTAVKLNVGEAEVTNNTFKGVANGYYNAIEFGINADNNNLQAATISGNTFESAIVNNYFNFYNMTDGAQINIVNNKLLLAEKSSNGIRISNFRNATGVTFKIDSDEYTYAADSVDSEYEGLILLQDFFKDSNVQNFSGITIDVTNLSAPKSAKQLLYVYDDHTQSIITTNQPKLTGDDSLAQFYAAKVGDTYYKTLADAVAAANNGETVTLLKDVQLGNILEIHKNLTLDLGGKTLSRQGSVLDLYGDVTIKNGTITTTGTGTGAVWMNQTAKLIVEDDVTMTAPADSFAIGYYQDCTAAEVTFKGKITGGNGITVNGLIKDTSTNNKLVVDGAKITVSGQGIYQAGYAETAFSVNDSTISGSTGIEVRAGKLNVTNSVISGSGEFKCKPNDNGGTTDGAGIAIAQHTTKLPIEVTISDGEISGPYAIYESNPQQNDADSIAKVKLSVTGGKFNGRVYSEDIKGFITGGYFTTDPSAYVASGYVAGTSDVSGYSYKVVAKTNTGNVEVKPDVADPEVTVSGSISEEDKKKVENAAKTVSAPTLGAETGDIVKDINEDTAKTLIEKATTVQGNNKKLYVQSSLKVEPTAYNETTKTLALKITPQYRIVASTAATADDIELGDNGKNAEVVQDYQPMNITKATVVTMELPAGFAVNNGAKLSIQHTKSNGKVEYYTGTVTEQSGKHLLTFTTNGFSPFVISVPAAAIESKVYPTLQAAVDSAKNGDIIDLYKDVAADTKVTVAKSIKFTVNTDGKKFDAAKNIVAGSNTTVKVTGESSPYTYEFTYTKPSSGSSSGGSSSGKTTYKVTTSAVNNGGVNASPSNAEKGAAITITLSPDKGYKLDKLTVTDGSGKTVSTVKKSDTVYTFTMPASAVKVGVSYVKATETPSETKFNDVSANDWFASAVDYVTGKGMMNGTADNTFSPKANTTRGMVVTVLYRLENQPSTSAASFTDVASGAYYANAVAWANANGIVSGYGSGKFGPNDKVTREQLAAILYRYAQYKKYDVSVGEDTNILSYNDAQSISSYAIPAIQWACGAGVVTGKSGSKLDPKGNATRAEVAAMLMRFCENVK